MIHNGFTKGAPCTCHSHLNRYRRVRHVKEGPEQHRVTYEGPCFICGAPLTAQKIWRGLPADIPEIIKDRILCDEHK